MRRRVDPEILDSLPADDPRARRLHRGIEFFNVLLGNYRWFGGVLRERLRPQDRILEIGAGRGRLLRELQTRLGQPEQHWGGLDAATDAPEGFAGTWVRASALVFDGYGDWDVVIVNHLLHQFTDAELAALGEKLGGVRLLVASEPWRQPHCVALARLSPLIGMPRLAVHDGVVSVRAGLRRGELPQVLGLAEGGWSCAESVNPLGAIRLIATPPDGDA